MIPLLYIVAYEAGLESKYMVPSERGLPGPLVRSWLKVKSYSLSDAKVN